MCAIAKVFANRNMMHRLVRTSIRTSCGKAASANKVSQPTESQAKSLDYCIKQVQKYDRENYLAALCIRDVYMKRAVFALRAFNVELSLVRDSTTNSDRAKQRFFFWSKLVEEIIRRNDEGDPNIQKTTAYYKHAPVAKELLDLFYTIDMTDEIKSWLNALIGARVSSKVLGYQPFDSMEELELYCYKSNGSFYHLVSSISTQSNDSETPLPAARLACENLGKAHGISNIIRGIPYNSTQNCCYVPLSLLDSHRLTVRNFIGRNFDSKKAAPVVEHLSGKCQELLDHVHGAQKMLPQTMRDLLLPRVAIQSNLNKLRECNYDIGDKRLARRNHMLPIKLWLVSKFGRAPII